MRISTISHWTHCAPQSRTMTNLAVKCSLCDANHARKKCDVLWTYLITTLLAFSNRRQKINTINYIEASPPLLYLPFKLHLKRDCSQIHFHKTGFKTCTLPAAVTSTCSTWNHQSRCPTWKILSCLCCQGTYSEGVAKTPRYPTEARCCSGYFQTARVLHHFHPVARGASLWCCTTICWRLNGRCGEARRAAPPLSPPFSFSGCNRDWFLCLSLMTLYDCCV